MVAPPALITTIKGINENNVFTEPFISQRAGLHALRNREVIQQTIVDTFIKRTMTVYERIKRIENMEISKPR